MFTQTHTAFQFLISFPGCGRQLGRAWDIMTGSTDNGERAEGHWVIEQLFGPSIKNSQRRIWVSYWPHRLWEGYDEEFDVNDINLSSELAQMLLAMTDEGFLRIDHLVL